MIDVGTIPKRNSISQIITYMDAYDHVGGACGEIEVFRPSNYELGYPKYKLDNQGNKIPKSKGDGFEIENLSWWMRLEAWALVLAQYVEYKSSHYIEKTFETLFGFISVLPGAFSTLRYEAIKGDPLDSFFKGLDSTSHSAKEANMYLAEDRILCLEIIKKLSKKYVLRYIGGAIALTDPPTSVIGLIKQRRRWTNGSLFASWYVIDHLNEISRSRHSCCK